MNSWGRSARSRSRWRCATARRCPAGSVPGWSPAARCRCASNCRRVRRLDLRLLLGEAVDEAAAQALVEKYRAADIDGVLGDIAAQWNDLLDTVQVRTPDRAMDILLNDWLLYQVTSCRLWARTAYYQASGA